MTEAQKVTVEPAGDLAVPFFIKGSWMLLNGPQRDKAISM